MHIITVYYKAILATHRQGAYRLETVVCYRRFRDLKTLTVITTTYNRAYCLEQLYQSLISQQNNDFIWLVIDDGSTDNTKELIDKWQHEGLVEIEYYYKQNGGMHTARNLAYEKVHTELNTIIDSDENDNDNSDINDVENKEETE